MSFPTNSSLVTITAIPSRFRSPLANRNPISDSARLVDRRSPKRFSTTETSVYILPTFGLTTARVVYTSRQCT